MLRRALVCVVVIWWTIEVLAEAAWHRVTGRDPWGM
jgi:hypothetical protein